MNNLPSSWVTAPLENIAHVDMGQSPESQFYNDSGEGLPFFQGKTEFGSLYPTVRKWCTDPKKIADKGDILLSVRAPVGPTNVAAEQCCIGRGLAAIRAQDPVSQAYLLHLFRNMEPWLSEQGTGTTFAAVSGQFLRSIEVALAPLNEQKRIADKLDAVLARVDACRDRLDRVPAILKRFRQSVLAAATAGKLTEDWRSLQGLSNEVQSVLLKEDEIIVPESWSIFTLREVIDPDRPLCYGVVQPGDERSGGVPLIRVQDMDRGGVLTSELRTVSPDIDAEYKRSRVIGGDLLVSVVGTIGRTAIVPHGLEANIARAIARVACKTGVNSKWVNYWLSSEALQWWLTSSSKEVARKTLNLSDIALANVAIPSVEEQTEIVRRVEALFAYADRIEARHQAARTQVEKLTPATLAKAFRGELVPQDPNDEPASVLLQRIHAQRNDQAANKPSHSRRERG